MANYNHARYLPEALQALLDQTHVPTEIIVIDDGSTDNSVEVIERFARKSPIIRLFRNDVNRGALYSINRALNLASCDYIAFQAADDRVLPNFFEECMTLLKRYPQAALCSGLCFAIDGEGKDGGLYPSPVVSAIGAYLSPRETQSSFRRYGPWIMGNATVLRKAALVEAGGLRPELHSFCDGFVYMVMALKHGACFVPKPLACWRRMETGYSYATHSNSKLRLDIRDAAVNLMRTTYRDLFPKDFVDSWARRDTAAIGLTAHDQMRRERERLLAETFSLLLPLDSWQGRWFVRGVRLIFRVESRLLYLLLIGVFGDFPDWVARTLRTRRKK